MTNDKYRELSVVFVHAASNVLVNSATDEAWLTGFGMASRLPASVNRPSPPSSLREAPLHGAGADRPDKTFDRFPERSLLLRHHAARDADRRSSVRCFRSHGMGALPHCKQPASPGERLKNIPGPVSATIMKLLAKTAEERYQTVAGAESDLRRCLAEWETRRRIDEFPLGEHDTPDRLLILEKLYGRAREIETLLASFDRIVAGGSPELMLVSGYSGVGKSSVAD